MSVWPCLKVPVLQLSPIELHCDLGLPVCEEGVHWVCCAIAIACVGTVSYLAIGEPQLLEHPHR
jgi:hypothetical protein